MIQHSSLAFQPAVRTVVTYAGFWRRALAYLIDSALLVVVQSALFLAVALATPLNYAPTSLVNPTPTAQSLAWEIVAIGEGVGSLAGVSAALSWAYYSILESSPARATVGKALIGLYVGDVHGDPISFARASARYWLKILSTTLVLTGWVMAAFTPRKQALHDVLAGTLVLRNVTYVTSGPGGITEPGEYWDGKSWVATVPPAWER